MKEASIFTVPVYNGLERVSGGVKKNGSMGSVERDIQDLARKYDVSLSNININEGFKGGEKEVAVGGKGGAGNAGEEATGKELVDSELDLSGVDDSELKGILAGDFGARKGKVKYNAVKPA